MGRASFARQHRVRRTVTSVASALTICCLFGTGARGAIYRFSRPFAEPAGANVSEGQMFSYQDSPLGLSAKKLPLLGSRGNMVLHSTGPLVDTAIGKGDLAPKVSADCPRFFLFPPFCLPLVA